MHTTAPVLSQPSTVDRRSERHPRLLALVALLATAVLIVNARDQIYDSNFYALSEATALLAGDHPYRDFFDTGMPLAAYLSAGVQLLVGRRLIGEFAHQWLFIVAGVVISCHLALRLSRSAAASLATMALALIILFCTPTYHYSKLFFFPLTIWVAWRYMDRPGAVRSAVVGLTTASAFLFRHDYGVYIGFASIVAFALVPIAGPAPRRLRSLASDWAAYAVAVAIVVTPWVVVVQMNEGLLEYTRMRASLYQEPRSLVYASLVERNPFAALMPEPTPAPKSGVVGFFWKRDVNAERRRQLELQHGLRLTHEGDGDSRWQYEVANVYDGALLKLVPYIDDTTGIDWNRLHETRWHLPTRDNAVVWLEHVALLIPLLLLTAAGWEVWRSRSRPTPIPRDVWRMVLAGAFLAAVHSSLFRQPSYMATTAPVTAAMSAWFLAGPARLSQACAIAVLCVTAFAALVWARGTPLYRPFELGNLMSDGFAQLMASPPVDGNPSFRYLYECTAPGDRVIVTGSTPLHVSYYAERPMAGGHLAWHYGWRSDPVHEAQSLALLQRQSVPFAYSTHGPVLDDFKAYPRIREYLVKHYAEIEGSNGWILVDTRREPARRFGPEGWPCFR
jgi:hypothetical protein